MNRDDDVKQAIGQVAKLGGFNIKRMATTDDLKDHTITITITRASDGWHQERLPFEDTTLVAHVDGNGHVDSIDGLAPGDLAETEAEAEAEIAAGADTDPDEAATTNAAVTDVTDEHSVVTEGTVVELTGKKRR